MTASREIELTLSAQEDIVNPLDWSAERFGPSFRRRYEALIEQALKDLREGPMLPGSRDRSELGSGIRTLHLKLRRHRARTSEGIVRAPRHMLVYERPSPTLVMVLRVLHDVMDIERRLPLER